jgi:hypothetical protein
MRARPFRPSFDILLQRITPSDIMPLGGPVVAAPVDTSTITGTPTDTGDMPGSTTPIINNLGPWLVTGTPQPPPTNVLNPTVDPTTWAAAGQ